MFFIVLSRKINHSKKKKKENHFAGFKNLYIELEDLKNKSLKKEWHEHFYINRTLFGYGVF